MAYRIFTFFALLSLLLFLGTAIFWWRIHYVTFNYTRKTTFTPNADITDNSYFNIQSIAQSVAIERVSTHLDVNLVAAGVQRHVDDDFRISLREVFTDFDEMQTQEVNNSATTSVMNPGRRASMSSKRLSGLSTKLTPPTLTIWQRWGFDAGTVLRSFFFIQNEGKWVVFPFWILVWPWAILPAIWLPIFLRRRARHRRIKQGYCTHCGYDLRASPNRCPECGAIP